MKKKFSAVRVQVTHSIREIKHGRARKRRYDVFKLILAAFLLEFELSGSKL